jgi:sugar phosphate isomerase/epimerase
VDDVAAAIAANGQRIFMASGGWCDFFDRPPAIDQTWRAIERQVAIARRLGVPTLRLFFGQLTAAAFGPAPLDTAGCNLQRLSERYPDMSFVFENHDGASLIPGICRDVLQRADRPNIQMNFDPINFERAGTTSADALAALRPLIAHVHLKGLERGEYCGFGTGEVDLTPMLHALLHDGYAGRFTVEYEGPFDRTLGLYESVRAARTVVAAIEQRCASE